MDDSHGGDWKSQLRALGVYAAGILGLVGIELFYRIAHPLIAEYFGGWFATLLHWIMLLFGIPSLFMFILQFQLMHVSELGKKLSSAYRRFLSSLKPTPEEVEQQMHEEFLVTQNRESYAQELRVTKLTNKARLEEIKRRLTTETGLSLDELNQLEENVNQEVDETFHRNVRARQRN